MSSHGQKMDYLDPKKKKMKKARIMIGYALMGVAISISTVVLVYLTNGYFVDTETGVVIQNGLIYVDSKPESARVILNGEQQRGSTDARLVVPEGSHKIDLVREGYRSWTRTIQLEGGKLRQLTYARLIPDEISSEVTVDLPSVPEMSTQSIDKRWIVMSFAESPLNMKYVDLAQNELELTEVPLPLGLVDTKNAGVWEAIEWADDNKTFLAKYVSPETTEYVLIDRDVPANSKNLAEVFTDIEFTKASIYNRKKDLVYLYNSANETLLLGNVKDGVTTTYEAGVIEYSAFGTDAVLYVTSVGPKDELVDVVLRKGDEKHLLRRIKQDNEYFLELSKFDNALVVAAGSKAENRVIVFKDPIKLLNTESLSKLPVASTILPIKNPTEVSMSTDSSIVMARNAESVATYEFEVEKLYTYNIDKTLDNPQKTQWLDGKHLTFSSGKAQHIIDFDGSNLYELVDSVVSLGSYYDEKIDFMYTFTESSEASPPRIIRSSLRSEKDR